MIGLITLLGRRKVEAYIKKLLIGCCQRADKPLTLASSLPYPYQRLANPLPRIASLCVQYSFFVPSYKDVYPLKHISYTRLYKSLINDLMQNEKQGKITFV